jgi:glutaredoxin
MKIIRWILSKLILFFNATFPARATEISPAEQARLDQETKGLLLYEFEACPFCVKVRRAARKMNLKIETRDAKNPTFAAELVKGGGDLQVPCLRITAPNEDVRWLYQSGDIISYLGQCSSPGEAPSSPAKTH